jgi:surface antigen/peptidoglycan hydrolase CwlO-like protein
MSRKKLKNLNSRLAVSAVLALIVVGTTIYGGLAKADQFDAQINQLQQQNSGLQVQSNSLAAVAKSYQDAINILEQQINVLQQSIVANQQKSNELKAQIAQAQADLEHEKKVLGENIKTMYLEGKISTLEVLASSNNLSDFVNKQEYRNSVQSKVKATLDKINALKVQLEEQNRELEVAIADLQKQQDELNNTYAQQSQMLSYTEGQKAAYDKQLSNNRAAIAELRRQQIAANARFIGGTPGSGPACGGGYPAKWCEIPQDSVIDSWGMYNRECVSYTAWRIAASGRYMPYWGGVGNANQWDDDARAAGIPVDSSPRPGDIAISNAGYYGHAMYVESVNDDGTINVSQYNASLDGRFSYRFNLDVGSLVFIHF